MKSIFHIRSAATIFILFTALALSFQAPLTAGVVFEVETKDHDQSPAKVSTTHAYAQGKNLKMTIAPGSRDSKSDMIFHGDRREMVVVDHDRKSYMVMDKKSLEAMSNRFQQGLSQMDKILEKIPKAQREKYKEMMKKRMPAVAKAQPRKKTQYKKTGDSKNVSGYPCVKYEGWRDGRKVRELWVTDWGNVEGGDEAGPIFKDMADFFEELLGSVSKKMGGGMENNFFTDLQLLGGFPLAGSSFDEDGSLDEEWTLRSAKRRTLDPAEFEPPSGYKRRSMFPGR
ncbi:MAG: hypothetical protein GY940_06025 [bacterium]|nr:hypothetical protein [bacterium]